MLAAPVHWSNYYTKNTWMDANGIAHGFAQITFTDSSAPITITLCGVSLNNIIFNSIKVPLFDRPISCMRCLAFRMPSVGK